MADIGISQVNRQAHARSDDYNDDVAGKTKIVPQAGWLPVTIPVVSPQQQPQASSRSSSVIGNVISTHKPIHFPVVHDQEIITVKPHNRGNVLSLFQHNSNFPPTFGPKVVQDQNVFLKPGKSSQTKNIPKSDFVPIETLTFQVETVSEPSFIGNHLNSPPLRNERAVLHNNNNDAAAANVDVDDDEPFIDRVRRLNCKDDVEKLIIDILESPLRQRNSLLVGHERVRKV